MLHGGELVGLTKDCKLLVRYFWEVEVLMRVVVGGQNVPPPRWSDFDPKGRGGPSLLGRVLVWRGGTSPMLNQGCAMPAKTGGQDAIKHVNPVGHGNCHLAQGANAHEVAGTISG